jgi:hypothetical protein
MHIIRIASIMLNRIPMPEIHSRGENQCIGFQYCCYWAWAL